MQAHVLPSTARADPSVPVGQGQRLVDAVRAVDPARSAASLTLGIGSTPFVLARARGP